MQTPNDEAGPPQQVFTLQRRGIAIATDLIDHSHIALGLAQDYRERPNESTDCGTHNYQPAKECAGHEAAHDDDAKCAIARLFEAATGVVMRSVYHDLVAKLLRGNCSIHNQALGPTNTQVGVEEDDTQLGSGFARGAAPDVTPHPHGQPRKQEESEGREGEHKQHRGY